MLALRKFSLALLIFLPSCVKYHKIFKSEFPQGQEKDKDKNLIDRNLQSASVYDQFTTKAIFDVLWKSDEISEHHVAIYSKKRGLGGEEKSAILRRHLEENKHIISFDVLAYIPENGFELLSDENSNWSFYLQLDDGRKVKPNEVVEVELSPEEKFLFGGRYTPFKTTYRIKFNALDVANNSYLGDNPSFKLVISSVDRDVNMSWGKTVETKIIKNKHVKTSGDKIYENEHFHGL